MPGEEATYEGAEVRRKKIMEEKERALNRNCECPKKRQNYVILCVSIINLISANTVSQKELRKIVVDHKIC